jgi:hypothetical protein
MSRSLNESCLSLVMIRADDHDVFQPSGTHDHERVLGLEALELNEMDPLDGSWSTVISPHTGSWIASLALVGHSGRR